MAYNIHQLRQLRLIIGRNIHQARASKRLSLHKLARLSDISPKRLDQFELGKNAIHLDELFRIAAMLQVSLHEVINDPSTDL